MDLIGFKVLVMTTSLQNIVISGAQGFLILMGSNFFDKDDQAAKYCWFYLHVSSFYLLLYKAEKPFVCLSVRPHFWHADISVVSALIETRLA